MKNLILFSLVLFHICCFAEELEAKRAEYWIESSTIDSCINDGKAIVRINVKNNNFNENDIVLYGYKGESIQGTLDADNGFQFELDSGTFNFQFYPKVKIGYSEIFTAPIEIKEGYLTTISIRFDKIRSFNTAVKKPVIYLYPEEETDVSLSVNATGEMTFMYPEYNDAWNFKALPNGDLTFGDKTFDYLFWEADQNISFDANELSKGNVLQKEQIMDFLENSLDAFGFNSKEKADFITFWGPQMIQNDQVYVHFTFNEECSQFAELEISPKPQIVARFYMIWSPVENAEAFSSIREQSIPKMSRDGFFVLEWGGSEINLNPTLSQK